MKELEITVKVNSNYEKLHSDLERIGFKNRSYQENSRIQYVLNNVEIDIDSWPMIPTYLEIEGNSEQDVIEMQNLLGVDSSKLTTLNCDHIYKEIYGIDISAIKELKF